jgi:hypothetical protein
VTIAMNKSHQTKSIAHRIKASQNQHKWQLNRITKTGAPKMLNENSKAQHLIYNYKLSENDVNAWQQWYYYFV